MRLKRVFALLLTGAIMVQSGAALAADSQTPTAAQTVTVRTASSTSENKATVYRFLRKAGFSNAAVCGIMANIQCESNFNPGDKVLDTNNLYSYGICQWNGSRFTRLKQCRPTDYYTLNGQLNYLVYELERYYPRVYNYLRSVPNTAQGAYQAGHYWCYYFEIPANRATVSVYRGNIAKNTYWPQYKSTGTADVADENSPAKISLSTCTVKLSTSTYTYSGKNKNPKVTVRDSVGKKVPAGNYTISYPTGRKSVGTHTVLVTAKGDKYTGSQSAQFTIRPNATSIRKLLPSARAFRVQWSKKTTQTAGYHVQYALDQSFATGRSNKIIKNSQATSVKISGLQRKTTYYVRVRTFQVVDGERCYSAWSAAEPVVTR